MERNFFQPNEVLLFTAEQGVKKSETAIGTEALLGFLGGGFIGLGFLASIRITAMFSGNLSGLGTALGSMIFPLGLIFIVIGGGELLTGNMMVMGTSLFNKKISKADFCKNIVLIGICNLVGAIFTAYLLGHVTGLTEGEILQKTIAVAKSKVDAEPVRALVSAIGCNWVVGMAVWMSFAAKDLSSKLFLLWFPITGFVIMGFQHVVANMFIIPAAIFGGGNITWMDFAQNILIVFTGNLIGAVVFVSGFYTLAYGKRDKK